MKDGVKIHVRQMKSFLVPGGQKDSRITVRPTMEQMKKYGILHFKGKQYRYLLFLYSATAVIAATQQKPLFSTNSASSLTVSS